MRIVTRWPMLLAVCGSITFPTLLRSKRRKEQQAHKAELHEWENEGGNVASAADTARSVSTAGSA
jgi:hypothetical protein